MISFAERKRRGLHAAHRVESAQELRAKIERIKMNVQREKEAAVLRERIAKVEAKVREQRKRKRAVYKGGPVYSLFDTLGPPRRG